MEDGHPHEHDAITSFSQSLSSGPPCEPRTSFPCPFHNPEPCPNVGDSTLPYLHFSFILPMRVSPPWILIVTTYLPLIPAALSFPVFFRHILPADAISIQDLTDDLLTKVLSNLPAEERLKVQLVRKQWRDALRQTAAWGSIDLRGVRPCKLGRGDQSLPRVLRYLALAIPEAAPGSPPPASRLRRLGLSFTYGPSEAKVASLMELGRHPASANMELLDLACDFRWTPSDVGPYSRLLQTTDISRWWPGVEGESASIATPFSFPVLTAVRVDDLCINVGVDVPAQDESPAPFLAACSRVAGLLWNRNLVTTNHIFFTGVDFDDVGEGEHHLDAPPLQVMEGLIALMEAVSGHVVPRLSAGLALAHQHHRDIDRQRVRRVGRSVAVVRRDALGEGHRQPLHRGFPGAP